MKKKKKIKIKLNYEIIVLIDIRGRYEIIVKQ